MGLLSVHTQIDSIEPGVARRGVLNAGVDEQHTCSSQSNYARAMPTYWLSVLSHVAPPCAHRKHALVREYGKIGADNNLRFNVEILDRDITKLRPL